MANGNNVDLVGNLTRDPELRYTPGGTAVASFGLAVNRRIQNRQTNEWEDRPSYFDIVCYGSLGENAAESLGKGSRVLVTGRLEQRSWETGEGERRSKVEVVADEVGPSLRWATVDITRNASVDVTKGERRPDGGGFGGGSGASAGPSGGRGAKQPAPAYDYDEEPF